MKRLILLIGLGIGYVLGSKAGREQYRKIKTTASKTWQSPAVRNAAEKVEAFVGEKAPALGGVAHTVLGGSGNGSSSSTPSGNGTSSTSPSGSSYTAPGAGSTDTGFSETGSNTAGSTLGGPVSDADLKLDTDLGTEGERPA
ncbi:hypothetical protein ACFDTO_06145 [Microbacteriaceae bacterium 4G12]